LLSGILQEAEDNEYIERNPARKVQLPPCKASAEHRSMTEQEALHLFSSLSGLAHLLFRLLVLCGLRIGEALSLRWNDVCGNTLVVDESALQGKSSLTKNRKTRIVPLTASLQLEL